MLSLIILRSTYASMVGVPKIIRTPRQIARGISNREIWWLDHPSSINNGGGGTHPGYSVHQAVPPAPHSCQKVYLSTAPMENNNNFQEGETVLTRTTIRRMKVANLREELSSRGLDTAGKKPDLVKRLQETLDQRTDTNAIQLKTVDSETPPDEVLMVPEQGQHDFDDYFYHDDMTMAHYNEKPLSSVVTDQSIYHEHEVASTNTISLDPERKYVIRVRTATSGLARVVEGVRVGMSLLVESEDGSGALSLLETNQLLLPDPGRQTSVESDYCALIVAMREAKKRGIERIIVEIDDIGIVQQLTGEGSVVAGEKGELFRKAMQLKETFQSFEVRTHPGPENCEEAKLLAKTALAKQLPLEAANWAVEDEPSPPASTEPLVSIDPKKEYLLRFDGGARGNPSGVAGAGMVIYDGDEEVWAGWKYLGMDITNNIAEYAALIEGLHCAKKLGVRRIRAEGDSELVVKQVLGQYKVKKDWLIPLHKEVKELSAGFDNFSLGAIRRAANSRADCLANHAMDVQDTNSLENIIV